MKGIARTAVLAAAVLAAAGCSLKEDRAQCPCWLDICLRECASVRDGGPRPVRAVEVTAWNGRHLFGQKVGHEDFTGPFERAVPKGMVSVSVTAGEEKMTRDGWKAVLHEGEEADELFAHASQVPCLRETAADTARLHKQFARVHLKVTLPDGGAAASRTFRVESDACGLDLRDLTPLDGDWGRDLECGRDGTVQFNLIRQRPGSRIRLLVLEDGKVADTLPLDEWIRAAGYSWLARDLEDISADIDYGRGEVTVSVSGWEDGGGILIEI